MSVSVLVVIVDTSDFRNMQRPPFKPFNMQRDLAERFDTPWMMCPEVKYDVELCK
jgi:hypothetical protein